MGTFLRIDGDPNEISGTGAILRSMAESFQSEAGTLLSEIQAIDGERPWASDEYGQAFETNYVQPQEGEDQPIKEAVQERMSQAGESLARLGDQTILAMTEYQGVDAQSAAEINDSHP